MDGSGIKQNRQPETPVRHLTQKMFGTRPQRPHISTRTNEKKILEDDVEFDRFNPDWIRSCTEFFETQSGMQGSASRRFDSLQVQKDQSMHTDSPVSETNSCLCVKKANRLEKSLLTKS